MCPLFSAMAKPPRPIALSLWRKRALDRIGPLRQAGAGASVAEETRPQRAAVGILRREDRAYVLADAEEVLRAVAGSPAPRATAQRQPDQRHRHTVSPARHRYSPPRPFRLIWAELNLR